MNQPTYDYGNNPEAAPINGTAHGVGEREIVDFVPNVPTPMNQKYAKPKQIQTRRGIRYLITTMNNRVAFVDADVAQKIEELLVKPGEDFWICYRHNGKRADKGEWQVWLDPAVERKRADAEMPQLERQLRASLDQMQRGQQEIRRGAATGDVVPVTAPTAPGLEEMASIVQQRPPDTRNHTLITDGRPGTKLEAALKTVVYACKSANDYAKEIGYPMPAFNGDELVRMVNTLLINDTQRNGHA
jgi:hypothetical protein